MGNGYSICFNEWALDKDIKSELGLLLIISGLTAKSGYAYAKNEYFSKIFNVDEVTISRRLKKLVNKNYIKIDYTRRGCEVIERKIRLTKMLTDDLQKRQPTINKNVKDNNTSINSTSINKEKETKRFNFRKSLIDYGFKEELVEDWLIVRKNKKASNTKTAFNGFIKQVELCNLPINEILTECINRSWKGFKKEWLDNSQKQSSQKPKKEDSALIIQRRMGLID